MSLLQAPAKVSRTFRSIGRIRQISTVFAKYGFQEFMGTLGFGRFVPAKYRRLNAMSDLPSAAVRLRRAFEELGPTFIKLGQVLSTRSDLLPEAFATEFVKLQDRVSPLPFSSIRQTVEAELQAPLSELFASFNETPLACASIGQVHEAALPDGTRVVVKVQRPGIDAQIKADVSILRGLAAALERYAPETRVLAPQVLVEEFFQAMSLELDFIVEANNILKSRNNLKRLPEIYIPDVHLSLTTHKVLVIEKLDGIKVDNSSALRTAGYSGKILAELTAKAFLSSALEDGFFHGDLHCGNLFAMPPSQGETSPRLGMIDFGVMGYLTPRARESLLRIFVALAEEDFETLCMEYAELGAGRGQTDFAQFQRQLQSTIAPFLGLPLANLNVGRVLLDATGVAARHQIRIPREWMMVFKAIYTLEGTCRKLDPSFNAMPFLENYVAPMLQPKLSWEDFSRDMLLGSRDVQQIAHSLPRQMHWFFKRLAANNYAFEVKDIEATRNREASSKNFGRLAAAIFASALLASGVYALHAQAHGLSIGFFILALWTYARGGKN